MAKVDPNTFLGKGGQSSFGGVAAAVVSPLANANAKALNNISKGLSGLDQNLKGLLTIQQSLLKDRKRKEVLDRRKAQRQRDSQREQEIESMSLPRNAGGLARGGELKGKEKNWAGQLFKSLFGGLEFLLAGALKFLIALGTFAAVRTILQIVGDPANRQKLELFFTKLQFVWNKISGFASWLVQDNLLDGFTSLFGEKSTFGERLQGLGKILIGIIGLKLLLDPFGLIFGVLDLLNAREAKARAQQAGPGQPGGPAAPPKKDPRLQPTRKRDIFLKRDKLSRIRRLRQSLSRIKARRFGIIDAARVGVRRPGRLPGLAAGLAKQTPRAILNGFKGLYRGARAYVRNIPLVGMLLNFAFETLDVDAQGNLTLDIAGKGEAALYKSIGMGLGAAAGAFIPIPVVGSLLGATIGEYGGSLIYQLVKGASGQQVMDMMRRDAQNTLDSVVRGAGAAWNWITGAYGKFYSGLDKKKLPSSWILGPLSGVEVPDVIKIGQNIFKYASNFVSALFGGDVKPGTVTPLIQNPFQKQPENESQNNQNPNTSGHTDLTRNGGRVPPVNDKFQTGVKSDAPDGGTAAFQYILAMAIAAGGARHPELVAARAMHESEWLKKSSNSVFNSTGRTNPYGQTGDRGYGSVPRAGFPDPWTVYPTVEKATQDHIYLWHSTHKFKDNANAFDVPIDAIAASINAYSPNKDPENQRRGFTENAYVRSMVSILKRMGYDPYKSKGGGANVAPTNAKASSVSPNSPPSTNNSVKSDNQWWDLLDLFPNGERQSGAEPTAKVKLPPGIVKTSDYGEVRGDRRHGGTDIAAASGTDLVAPTDGVIVDYGSLRETGAKRGDPNGWGNFVVFRDSNGMYHLYGHILDGFRKGGSVKAGEKIADVGSTGKSTGPHLHWELGSGWTGGILTGKRDPLSVYGIEAPFVGVQSDDRGATQGEPTNTVPATDTSGNNQWWDPLDVFPNQQQQENTVPERPIGQKATLNGEPVVWDGKEWVPDTQAISPGTPASILKGVLALPPGSTTFGLSPLDQNAISAFLNAIQTGGLKLFLAPEGLGTAASILQGGGALVDGAGNLISGAVDAIGNAAGGLFGGGFGGGNQVNDPTAPSEKPILEDPIGEAQKYLEPQESDKILWSDIQNNWYGNKNLSIEDGINIFRKKIEQGGKYKTADDYTGNIFKDVDILFGGSKEAPSKSRGGPLPNNLPGYFLGKFFKGVGNFFKGVVNTVKKAVSGIGNFLNSPLGSILTTVLSVAFPAIAPIISGIKAVVALSQGDIMGAIVGGVGALGGMFPGTFGAEGTFWGGLNNALGEGLGGVAKGFLTGGFGGAIGALPGIMPEGVQAIFRGIGGFMEKHPGIANVVQMLPGLAGVPGFDGMLGMPAEPGMPGMGGLAGVMTAAQSQGAGGVLNAVMGGITGTQSFQSAIPEIAAELGVKPEVLGGFVSRSKIQNPLDEKSREYALQTSIEITQVPIIIERLVEIPKPVPINNFVPVKQPAQ